MYIEILDNLQGSKLDTWKNFLKRSGLEPDTNVSRTVLIWDCETLVAVGSRQDDILKCVAVDSERQGEDLASLILTALRKDAFEDGSNHLFLYTKPENEQIFTSLFFYKIAKTDRVLLMENKKDGIKSFVGSLDTPCNRGETVGAIVMNCNPFTLGHRYLIETAARECDTVHVLAVSEDKSRFTTEDRMAMLKLGTQDIKNVSILPTGPYLISAATFPTYFLKKNDKASEVQCMLDTEIFSKYYAPRLGITRRYVGTEPLCPVTSQYNEILKRYLPMNGIEVFEIPRLKIDDTAVSASRVRELVDTGDIQNAKKLLPEAVYGYMKDNNLI